MPTTPVSSARALLAGTRTELESAMIDLANAYDASGRRIKLGGSLPQVEHDCREIAGWIANPRMTYFGEDGLATALHNLEKLCRVWRLVLCDQVTDGVSLTNLLTPPDLQEHIVQGLRDSGALSIYETAVAARKAGPEEKY